MSNSCCNDVSVTSIRPASDDDEGNISFEEDGGHHALDAGGSDSDADTGSAENADGAMGIDGAPKQSVSTAADVATLREEQSHDETLLPCFVLAKQDKGSFSCKDSLLYRRECIVGEPCELQLVLQVSRREQVLRSAHGIRLMAI